MMYKVFQIALRGEGNLPNGGGIGKYFWDIFLTSAGNLRKSLTIGTFFKAKDKIL